MKVFTIDPGPHCGCAAWGSEGFFQAWEWTEEDFRLTVEGWIQWADTVVIEAFRIGGQRGAPSNVTIEQIGVARFLAARWGREFVEQEPGAYRFGDAKKLKQLGWYTVGSDHARSATGHLLLFLVNRKLMDPRQFLAS